MAGVALWGPLLDRLNMVAEADRRGLRPIGPGGFLSGRVLLADAATAARRGTNPLPSVSTLCRFLAGADLGRVARAAATNRVMLRRGLGGRRRTGGRPADH